MAPKPYSHEQGKVLRRIQGLFKELAELQKNPNIGIDRPREVCWWMLVDMFKMYHSVHKEFPTKVYLPKAYEAVLSQPVFERTGGIPLREMETLLGMELILNAEQFKFE